MRHVLLERHPGLMAALCVMAASVGALAQLLPLGFQEAGQEVTPLDALALEGQRLYLREGCQQCHTRMVRDLPGDQARHASRDAASRHLMERPALWGNARQGPDLSRLPAEHDEAWQRLHLYSPRHKVADSSMPAYPWLFEHALSGEGVAERMQALQALGVPYRDDEILAAPARVRGKAEATALLAYLQQTDPPRHSSATAPDPTGETLATLTPTTGAAP